MRWQGKRKRKDVEEIEPDLSAFKSLKKSIPHNRETSSSIRKYFQRGTDVHWERNLNEEEKEEHMQI